MPIPHARFLFASLPAAVMAFAGFAAALLGLDAQALASEPKPWQIGMQDSATPVKERLHDFHTLLMVLMSMVVVTVLGLLIYVSVRFRKTKNPESKKFSHNTTIEVIWTGIPLVILIIIAAYSLPMIYYMDKAVEPELTIKTTGYQWYWSYEYPDLEIAEYAAYMIPDEEIGPGEKRLLSTDYKMVAPVDTNVQLLVTAGDVLHSFAMPSFGVKKDAVPGRLNETWFNVKEEGVYYGQCSELCGTGHAFMPSEVHVVSKAQFEKWAELAKDDIDAANQYIIEIQHERDGIETDKPVEAAAVSQ